MTKYCLLFNDEHPNGIVTNLNTLKKQKDFYTYMEIETIEEALQWQKALKDMQPVFKLEELNNKKYYC